MMRSHTTKQYRHGFTIVEILVVIAIIGVLAAFMLSNTEIARDRARYAAMLIALNQLANAARLDFDTKKVWATDVGPNSNPAFVGTAIDRLPSIPCPNWAYDWENWPVPDEDPTIRVTVRSDATPGTNANARFYICIQSSDAVDCHTGGPTNGGTDASIDVKKATPDQRKLVCQ